jgi:YARHG domain-containing protein
MFSLKSSSFFKFLTIFALILIITTTSSCSNNQKSAAVFTIQNNNQNQELINNTTKDNAITNNNSKNNKTSSESEKTSIKITIDDKEFDLSTLLNTEDVQDLDDFQLSLLRNAYYAKHGYKFNMKEYLDFFSKYDWYNPQYDNVENMLCGTDIDNINLILKVEDHKKSEENTDSNNKASTVKNTNKYKEFIFPNSDKKLISNKELNYCGKFTLLLAKNELFARKGYKFKNKQLSNYYNNMSWYTPNDNIKNSADELNEIEKKNLELINDRYNNFYYSSVDKDNNYEINTKRDLNNDGIKETINILFKKDSLNPSSNSWEEYDFTINSEGENYTFCNTEINLYTNLFFADFDVNDNATEFYLTSAGPSADPTTTIFQLSENGIKKILTLDGFITGYDGKGNIYTEFSFTNDKNQVLLSYYNLQNGVQHPSDNKIIEKYLQYNSHLILFKTTYVIPAGFSDFGENYDEILKQYPDEAYKDSDIVKITDINEPLKIVYVDYDPSNGVFSDIVRNLPIKVETKDGLTGWLLHLNIGD